jgi:hypothetical protein
MFGKTVRNFFYSAILFAVACGTAGAQSVEIGVFGGYARVSRTGIGSPSIEQPDNNDTTLKADYSQGIRFTRNTRGYYGHEIGYMQTRVRIQTIFRNTIDSNLVTTNVQDRVDNRMVFYNFLLYFMPNGSHWRPFVTAGAQVYLYQAPNIGNWPDGGLRRYGGNWGGGLKLIPVKHLLIRFDARDYIGGVPYNLTFPNGLSAPGFIHQLEGSAGFSITF